MLNNRSFQLSKAPHTYSELPNRMKLLSKCEIMYLHTFPNITQLADRHGSASIYKIGDGF